MPEVNVPACRVVVNGLKAEFHVIHHQAKLQKHPLDAGIDIFGSAIEKSVDYLNDAPAIPSLYAQEIYISTLVHIVVPPGSVGILIERSSSVRTLGGGRVITGVIDASYTGEIKVRVLATAIQTVNVKEAINRAITDRVAIAQLLVQPVYMAVPIIQDLPKGGRGDAGFGSTSGLIGGRG